MKIQKLKKQIRRIRMQYRFRVLFPAVGFLILVKTIQCLFIVKVLKKELK